jgi:hypothetical protein
MAKYFYQIPAGGRPEDVTFGTGAPTVPADTVAIGFDNTLLKNKQDLISGIEQLLIRVIELPYPPV